jgi:sec-independent protein translocase protein TatA
MGGLSIWHWIIVIAVVLLLFGRGKISELMGDVAQGIKAFKKGMTEEETAKTEPEPVKTIDHQAGGTAAGAKPAPDLQNRAATEKRFEGGTA